METRFLVGKTILLNEKKIAATVGQNEQDATFIRGKRNRQKEETERRLMMKQLDQDQLECCCRALCL